MQKPATGGFCGTENCERRESQFCGNERFIAEETILRSSLSERRCDERVGSERIDPLLDAEDLLKHGRQATGFTETVQGSRRSGDR